MSKTQLKLDWSAVDPVKTIEQENQDLKKEQAELMRLRIQLILEISDMVNRMGYGTFQDAMNKQYGYPFTEVIRNKNIKEPIRRQIVRNGMLKIALSVMAIITGGNLVFCC